MRLFYSVLIIFLFSCEGIFERKFLLDIQVTPEGAGTVSLNNGIYKKGESILIQAIPNENYIFSGWAGDVVNVDNPLEFILDGNKEIIATFDLIDEDTDGIADASDTCVGTKRGSLVDENGCCIDAKKSRLIA